MKIISLKAKNILSIGNDGIEIDFTKYSNIVLIKGQNLDISPQSSNGAGKCWKKDTPILLFDGTLKMSQDIKVGDILMGNDSTPRTVLETHSGRMPMYKISPSKGESYTVNESHILVLKNSNKFNNDYKYSKFYNVTNDNYEISVIDYCKQSDHFKNLMKGYRTGVNFSSQLVSIDPYFLGIWLGDGTSSKPHITTADAEIVQSIFDEAINRNLNVTIGNKDKKAPIYRLTSNGLKNSNSLINDLKSYGLFNNKHVPHVYKANSREVRLQILAGLIDTDGSLSNGGFDFINKNKQLSEDVVFLARSLGLAAYLTECKKTCQTGASNIYWRVSISGDCSVIPIRIKRKQAPKRIINKNPLVVGIKVEPVGEDEYFGFQVDGNGLFLLGDFTVVHNSSIIECLVYGFYGKVIKGLNNKEIFNNKIKKNLEVEIIFEIDGCTYKIVRSRKSSSLGSLDLFNLSKSDPENSSLPFKETLGGMAATQELIEKKIRLSFDSFVNVVCFGEHNNHAFLSLKAENKRAIIENLLGLEKYIEYAKKASRLSNNLEADKKILLREYDHFVSGRNVIEDRINQLVVKCEQWNLTKSKDIEKIEKLLESKKIELSNLSDDGNALLKYREAQHKINSNKEMALKYEESRTKLDDIANELLPKINSIVEKRQDLLLEAKEVKHSIDKFTAEKNNFVEINNKLSLLQDGIKCKVCYSQIDKSNYANVLFHNNNCIESLNEKINIEKAKLSVILNKIKDIEGKIENLKSKKTEADEKLQLIRNKVNSLFAEINELSKIKEPSVNNKEIQLNEQINSLMDRLLTVNKEVNPYIDIISDANKEIKDKCKEIDECKLKIASNEALIPYFDFWVKGFGDKGIRSFVIDDILPALNSRINYWLQFLIDNKIQLNFDRQFEPMIERNPADGDPFVYSATSGGERRRINLAISQAFAHIMMLSTGICPSIISLDEVALNVDIQGINGIYKMINELARDRQVLITTHDSNLLELLDNSDIINVIKKDGFTKVS